MKSGIIKPLVQETAVQYNRGGTVNIFGGTIKGNSAYQGGAIYNLNGTTNIIGKSASNGPVIENNVGGYNGGGVYIHNGNLTTGYCKILNNSTSYARHIEAANEVKEAKLRAQAEVFISILHLQI